MLGRIVFIELRGQNHAGLMAVFNQGGIRGIVKLEDFAKLGRLRRGFEVQPVVMQIRSGELRHPRRDSDVGDVALEF